MTNPVFQSARFWAASVDECFLVADLARAECHLLNAASSVLFLLLSEGQSGGKKELLETYRRYIPSHICQDQVYSETLKEWSGLGWIEEGPLGLCLSNQSDSSSRSSFAFGENGRGELLPDNIDLSDVPLISRLRLSLNGSTVFDLELYATSSPIFPDAIPRLTAILSGVKSSRPSTQRLSFVVNDERAYVISTSRKVQTTDESFALSMLATELLRVSYSNDAMFATLHAAALMTGRKQFVFPAVSGCGKSTLAGYLAHCGWQYLGDDVIALGQVPFEGRFRVLPFATALGLKPGSWPFMEPLYPALQEIPITPYSGRLAKFIQMGVKDETLSPDASVHAIIFPQFKAGSVAAMKPLNDQEALRRVMESGASMGFGKATGNLSQFLNLIHTIPCYELHYGSSEDALRSLEALL